MEQTSDVLFLLKNILGYFSTCFNLKFAKFDASSLLVGNFSVSCILRFFFNMIFFSEVNVVIRMDFCLKNYGLAKEFCFYA